MSHSAFLTPFKSLSETLASWSPSNLGVNGSVLANWRFSGIIGRDNVLPSLSSDLISKTELFIFSLNIAVLWPYRYANTSRYAFPLLIPTPNGSFLFILILGISTEIKIGRRGFFPICLRLILNNSSGKLYLLELGFPEVSQKALHPWVCNIISFHELHFLFNICFNFEISIRLRWNVLTIHIWLSVVTELINSILTHEVFRAENVSSSRFWRMNKLI